MLNVAAAERFPAASTAITGGMLLLTVSIFVDRLGTEYGAKMPPDEEVAEVPGTDAPLARALAWLGQQGSCRTA
jgi:hypothetical protein